MSSHKKIIATLCYVIKDDKVLLIHRNKKENDDHEGKYNGLGGKSEQGEDPISCVIREMKEETGLTVKPIYRGNMTFTGFGKHGEDWEVHVFRAEEYSGELIDCPEGDLEWHSITDFVSGKLPIWPSDKLFLEQVFAKEGIFIGRGTYKDGAFIDGDITQF